MTGSKKINIALTIMFICIILIGIAEVGSLFLPPPAVTTEFPDTIQRVMPSVVHIENETRRGQASGVVITKDIIVTAGHVVRDSDRFKITMSDGTILYSIAVISHKDYDVGFLQVNKPLLKPAKFGSIHDCVLGQQMFTIGSPYGRMNFNSVTLGIVSGLDRDWDGLSRYGELRGWKIAFTTDSGAYPGNSGGPVFSMDGVVRGLLVGGFSPVLNCSMPSDLFLKDIPTIQLLFAQNKYQFEENNHAAYDQGF